MVGLDLLPSPEAGTQAAITNRNQADLSFPEPSKFL